jgi:hypothetical protein
MPRWLGRRREIALFIRPGGRHLSRLKHDHDHFRLARNDLLRAGVVTSAERIARASSS